MPAADGFLSGAATPTFEDLQQAAHWFALLQADSVSDADRSHWRAWLETGPGQRAAWQRVEAISGDFEALVGLPARRALERSAAAPSQRRRSMLRALAIAPAAGLAGWLAWREMPWRGWAASHRTDVGERRELMLADGTHLWLNTDTALDIDFSAALRRIALHRGEVLVTSGADAASAARALVVDVPQGRLTALGTRFAVRHLDEGAVRLTVYEGAVQAHASGGGQVRVLPAGQSARLYADRVEPPEPVALPADDWTRGMLVADNMRLHDFIAELGRYHRGYLGCAPEVAGLRIVGAYPLADTGRILSALEATLPVRVRQPLPWWTVVEAAPQAARR